MFSQALVNGFVYYQLQSNCVQYYYAFATNIEDIHALLVAWMILWDCIKHIERDIYLILIAYNSNMNKM